MVRGRNVLMVAWVHLWRVGEMANLVMTEMQPEIRPDDIPPIPVWLLGVYSSIAFGGQPNRLPANTHADLPQILTLKHFFRAAGFHKRANLGVKTPFRKVDAANRGCSIGAGLGMLKRPFEVAWKHNQPRNVAGLRPGEIESLGQIEDMGHLGNIIGSAVERKAIAEGLARGFACTPEGEGKDPDLTQVNTRL